MISKTKNQIESLLTITIKIARNTSTIHSIFYSVVVAARYCIHISATWLYQISKDHYKRGTKARSVLPTPSSNLLMRTYFVLSFWALFVSLEQRFWLWSESSSSSSRLSPSFAMGFSSRCIRTEGSFRQVRRALSGFRPRSLEPRFASNALSVLSRRTQSTVNGSRANLSIFSASSLTNVDSEKDTNSMAENGDEDEFIEDTIFALSSGFTGEQATAVAVIRISGPKANTVLEGLLKTSPSSKPRRPKYRQAALRKLYHPVDHSILDHALVLSFKGPNSFTGEDLVELQCHGSRVIVQRLLNEALPALGCRLAEPGEFTQRAFSEGKLDLVQVEALADILAAETHLQVEQGLKHLDGDVSKTYEDWRSQLISGLAHAEAVIDFGDDEHLLLGEEDEDDYGLSDEALQEQQESVWGEVGTRMMHLKQSMIDNLEDGRRGELIREGIKVAIVGESMIRIAHSCSANSFRKICFGQIHDRITQSFSSFLNLRFSS